jgi:hypothetical protein
MSKVKEDESASLLDAKERRIISMMYIIYYTVYHTTA